MRNIVKVYPNGTVALRGVDFEAKKGEIHGLLGENGAGKTTLMNILSGYLKPTQGEIYLFGEKVDIKSTRDAIEYGIGMVHQHFTLVDTLTALENIIMGMEPVKNFLMIDFDEARERIGGLIKDVGLSVNLDVPIEYLSVGERQRVEILKALYRKAKILILDEPTAVLTPLEVKELFNLLRKLKEKGVTIIFISHKLKEVLEITDRITVFRKGKKIGTVNTEDATPELLAKMMVGREVVFRIQKSEAKVGGTVLSVNDLWVKNDLNLDAVKGLSFEIRAGEIFGVAGVEGNGQSELVEAITGLRKVEKGSIKLGGVDITNRSPLEIFKLGVAHIPEDRHKWGLILDFGVHENLILGKHRFEPYANGMFIDYEVIYEEATKLVKEFDIIVQSVDAPVKSLSGGNQQKVIVAREFSRNPKLVVASQPTRGLDVGSTEYIRKRLLEYRDKGAAILLVSADLDEVLQLSDRIAVIYEGKFTGVFKPEELDEKKLGLLMGGKEAL
ncbi:MAG: ABC transporter ATP-binding protein [Candidatus Njordarchaeia archaeon]